MTRESVTAADKILQVNAALSDAAIPFAFGGAVARNYYAEPRLTVDIDIGVFLPPEEHPRVFSALSALFPIREYDEVVRIVERDAQVRLRWDYTPVDLFFSYDPFHAVSAERRRPVPSSLRIPLPAGREGGADEAVPIESTNAHRIHSQNMNPMGSGGFYGTARPNSPVPRKADATCPVRAEKRPGGRGGQVKSVPPRASTRLHALTHLTPAVGW